LGLRRSLEVLWQVFVRAGVCCIMTQNWGQWGTAWLRSLVDVGVIPFYLHLSIHLPLSVDGF
jgi:hypothetical protein